MTEEPLASVLASLPEGDPARPTAETLAHRHRLTLVTVYETIDDVISATHPMRHMTKWCIDKGLRP